MTAERRKNRQPDPFRAVQGADNSEAWKDFREAFSDYGLVEDQCKETPEKQVAIFRACLGDHNRQLLRSLNLGAILSNDVANPESPCRTLKEIIKKLDQTFAPHENVHFHRHLFSRIKQSEGETVSEFVGRVYKAVKPCKFTAESELVMHQLISGTCMEAARRIVFEADRSKIWEIEHVIAVLKQTEANNEQLPAFRRRKSPAIVETTIWTKDETLAEKKIIKHAWKLAVQFSGNIEQAHL
ncbi:uncharacterized protein LOC108865184 [Galendromus occidentalis]|uniref:Uncharacterized protein LOC108865184 n=1 Tax=Galendromus occidentalis TaxID=34638 RepID=A0AAJ7L6R3_9ACAR|nr:uncharacterized protein LOC108865184 [Galendromus occidentalis]